MIMCSWNFNQNFILPLRPYNLKVLGHKYPYKISLKYLVTFCAILQVIIFDVRSAVTTPESFGRLLFQHPDTLVRPNRFEQVSNPQQRCRLCEGWNVDGLRRCYDGQIFWKAIFSFEQWTRWGVMRELFKWHERDCWKHFVMSIVLYDVTCIRKCQTRIKSLLTDDIIRYKYVMTSL